MKTKAIIFDKDGTLIDFDTFWVGVSVNALSEVLAHLEIHDVPIDELLETLGVHDGVTDIDGALCKGTYAQIGRLVYDVLCRYGYGFDCDKVTELVIEAYNKNSDSGEVKPTCSDLSDVLLRLKSQNIKLAVVTVDNETITRKCLKKLGIEELFDKIYTDDGITPPKPDPYCAIDFAKSVGVGLENLVMVGDTMTDIKFAQNAGIKVIGVSKSDKNKEKLSPYAEAVISELSVLSDILE